MRSLVVNIPFLKRNTREIRIYPNENTLEFAPAESNLRVVSIILTCSVSEVRKHCITLSPEINNYNIKLEGYDSFHIQRNSRFGISRELMIIIR